MIGVKTVVTADLNEHRLVKVRNPYGFKEWKGDWSDKSKKWTLKTRRQVNGEDKEDGCFFMNLADFIKFFTRTTICFYMDDFEDNYITDQADLQSWGMVKFNLERDNLSPLCITVD